MSLRSELHAAYDELAPEDSGLTERVVTSATREHPRRGAWSLRLRAPLSLVAVFVVIAVVVGALIGPRLMADWRSFIAPPQPAAPQTPLQKLEARPLHFPTVHSTADCPSGPYDKNGSLGSGPLHLAGSAVSPETGWGTYHEDLLYADGPLEGPILVRGQDLVTRQRVVFVGTNSYGPVAGSDAINSRFYEQHLELVIDVPAPPYSWVFTFGEQKNASNCAGWQVDGPGFTEVFEAIR